MNKLVSLLIVLCLIFASFSALAQEEPEGGGIYWTYYVPLSELTSPFCVLADRDHLLDEDFVPSPLVEVNSLKKASSASISMQMDAADALTKLFEDAKAQGIILYLKSGYRSYGTQNTMYRNRVEKQGYDDGVVAMPGASDHQTGLGCDVLNADFAGKPRMTADFGLSQEGIWLAENCTDYGFIIRYPEGKESITNTIYEPWHLRYVGETAAKYITGSGLTLEEFTQEWTERLEEFEQAGGDVESEIAMEQERKLRGPQVYYLDEYADDGEIEVSLSF